MLPRAVFKQTPDDFIVDEIDAYPALGEGPHVLVRIRKRALNTEQAVARIAEALGINRRDCGFAGMKDRDAVTTQRVSVPNVEPERVMELAGRWPDLEILEAARHRNKLKPGHLRANRFRIRLREVERVDEVLAGLERIKREGFPNAFGPQRFGRDGDNAERALSFVRGETRPPRDPRERRMLFSALQSRWFNRVLEERVADGTWNSALLGDLLKKTDTGGMFLCEDLETDRARAERGEVSATGPMFGSEMTQPAGDVLRRELAVLAADGLDVAALTSLRALGEGTRRPLRVLIEDLVSERTDDGLIVGLTLGKGVYATTALANVVRLEQPRPAASPTTAALATGTARGHLGTHQVEEGADGPEEPEPS